MYMYMHRYRYRYMQKYIQRIYTCMRCASRYMCCIKASSIPPPMSLSVCLSDCLYVFVCVCVCTCMQTHSYTYIYTYLHVGRQHPAAHAEDQDAFGWQGAQDENSGGHVAGDWHGEFVAVANNSCGLTHVRE